MDVINEDRKCYLATPLNHAPEQNRPTTSENALTGLHINAVFPEEVVEFIEEFSDNISNEQLDLAIVGSF